MPSMMFWLSWLDIRNSFQPVKVFPLGIWAELDSVRIISGLFILMAISPGRIRLAGTRMSPFWILLKLRMMEVVVKTGAIRCAKLQSNCHHQQTNTQLFYRPDDVPVTQPTVSKHWRTVMLIRTGHARTRTSLTVTYCKLQLNLQSLSSNNNEHKVKIHNMTVKPIILNK